MAVDSTSTDEATCSGSTAIALAVEQQNSAVGEIANNVSQASGGTADVSSNIINVTQLANETGAAAGQVTVSAKELNNNADQLRGRVESFLSAVKAA